MEDQPVDYEAIERSIDTRKEFIEAACDGPRVALSNAGLDDLDALTVALQLYRRENPLHILDLSGNIISDEGIEAVGNSLTIHPELTDLYLGDNYFSSTGLIALTRTLPDLVNLDTLSLTGLNLDDDSITELASALMAMTECKLRRLYLSQNMIGDDGFLSLVVVFSSSKVNLEVLDLSHNLLTSSGLRAMSGLLEGDYGIIQLFLAENTFDVEGLESLSEGLCSNTSLKLLSLAKSGIDDEAFRPLIATLSVNETLESLYVWGNELTDQSGELLLDVLSQHNHTLYDVKIYDNPIANYEAFEVEMKGLLAQNRGAHQESGQGVSN
mmetsp:Transcript_32044/g.55259  ORF Transcript_32044/g.55259 Transcript_32044/m.55259 type:complete len:326 (-) Transcript_32044:1124-2101(-)